jgi:hypothetical protein
MEPRQKSPTNRGTARQAFRYDPAKWERFKTVAEPDASAVLRAFVDWYLHEPRSRAPRRPPKPDQQT